MPGLIAAKAACIAPSCMMAARFTSSCSSGLLITLMRSTSSLASTYFALGNFFMMKSPIANDIW